ncbi:uncharacterized protein LOC128854825 [Anastrepha ludens]|uniref:uncharacterized protein LOC128854825 n=1 Tax=Anastrepha ludens TaxID=28586 RepID=UPI0023AE957C|nr:uncharacterized protein LOC128854825 [Anastrepha ludens]XP_053945211.1 uncharacterized protein LOC128854825 [Anastrepha ludens]
MMKAHHFVRWFLVMLIQSHTSHSNEFTPNLRTTTDIILNDIRNAFKTVTNNTNLINRIIPQMYVPVMQQSKFVFLFEMPDDAVKSGHSIWMMQRSDLVDPVFPNLTFEYMRAQLNKNRLTLVNSDNLDEDTSKSSAQTHANTWSSLGLDGWTGAVAPVNANPDTNNEYPSSDILLDMENEEGNTEKDEDGESVYIARVNDPFGTSVKWELRNSTDRSKRDVFTLYSMIQCSTGCQPLIYKGYGCYCGFSGAGIPADGIDRCCKVHDKCYEYTNCISYLEYFVPYVWKCYRRKPLCAIDHGEFGGPGSCAARLCQCDIQLSRCLRRFSCPKRRAVCFSSRARRLQNFLLTF